MRLVTSSRAGCRLLLLHRDTIQVGRGVKRVEIDVIL